MNLRYVIDFDKVTTLDDVKRILNVLHLSFSTDSEDIASVQDLVRLEEYTIGRMDSK